MPATSTTPSKPKSSVKTVNPKLSPEAAGLRSAILHYLKFKLGRDTESASRRDWWIATATAVRDRMIERGLDTYKVHRQQNVRRLYYFSMEYLMGRLMLNSVINLGLHEAIVEALNDLGQDFDSVRGQEEDMGLGNGGLGRLAACYLDSLSTLDLPAVGYGIHYEFGLFRQEFRNGYQIEHPDNWIIYGAPWELVRPELTQKVQLFGRCEQVFDDRGNFQWRWVDTKTILGFPYDIPIVGYGTSTVNILRLWASKATEDFDLRAFNEGGYVEAVREKALGETISKVLYPNDKTESGKELRLVQQYFFVACSLRDILRRHFSTVGNTWDNFADHAVIQLNDTHPAIAIPELMRILLDEQGMSFANAWAITTKVFAYTNHTLLPEALERWSVPLMQRVLPRHLLIIYDINQHLMELVQAQWPNDDAKKRTVSLIEENGAKYVRMANLSVVGSFAVNGVAALHTRLLRQNLFPEFDQLFPGRFLNVTNGITPRRWLRACNPRLSTLISSHIGDGWVRDLDQLRKLERWADDTDFQREFMGIKRANKVDLASLVERDCGVTISPDALYDVQIKRLHEYKRQHLNLLHILALYRRLLQDPSLDIVPRVFLFAAKAAPGYDLAKAIIKSINAVAARVNNDARLKGKLKVAFLPNYRVSLAARIIPAADLSEQISTAGKEASGTGNMKLALNGALTIGTLDGANVEIREEVGDDNIFIFGNTVEQVAEIRAKGYNPWSYYERDEELRAVLDWLGSDFFVHGEPQNLPATVRASLLDGGDPFMVLADFRSYCDAQARVDAAYRDQRRWARSAILHTARVGMFSSDRSIRDYARNIWRLKPVK
jgi:glycogen phosphorylase